MSNEAHEQMLEAEAAAWNAAKSKSPKKRERKELELHELTRSLQQLGPDEYQAYLDLVRKKNPKLASGVFPEEPCDFNLEGDMLKFQKAGTNKPAEFTTPLDTVVGWINDDKFLKCDVVIPRNKTPETKFEKFMQSNFSSTGALKEALVQNWATLVGPKAKGLPGGLKTKSSKDDISKVAVSDMSKGANQKPDLFCQPLAPRTTKTEDGGTQDTWRYRIKIPIAIEGDTEIRAPGEVPMLIETLFTEDHPIYAYFARTPKARLVPEEGRQSIAFSTAERPRGPLTLYHVLRACSVQTSSGDWMFKAAACFTIGGISVRLTSRRQKVFFFQQFLNGAGMKIYSIPTRMSRRAVEENQDEIDAYDAFLPKRAKTSSEYSE